MGPVDLTIEQILLDVENPRINSASGQREALQKVVTEEPEKLIKLAKSIAKRGLSPMERLLVYRPTGARTYTVLEGNRRVAALKILVNPTSLGDLQVADGVRKRLEEAAKTFSAEKVEPIPSFDVGSRENARYWLELRHTGENEGEGVVPWNATARSRFLGGEPALEVLQFVREHGGLTDGQVEKVERRGLTTLRRLMESRPVRDKIGIEVIDNVIHSRMPAEELIKPFRQFVTDIAEGRVNSRRLGTVYEQAKYVESLPRGARPKRSTTGRLRPIEEIRRGTGNGRQAKTPSPKRTDPSVRSCLIPRNAVLNVSDPKVAAVVNELKKLRVDTFPHAISVLFRVFLDLSTDYYMSAKGIPLRKVTNKRSVDKKLSQKIDDVIQHLINAGARANDFKGIRRALGDRQSPLSIDLLNSYAHNRFVIPKQHDLLASWDEARPYFEQIWA